MTLPAVPIKKCATLLRGSRQRILLALMGLFASFVPKLVEGSEGAVKEDSALGVTTVVIDAGHGGKDPGAVGLDDVQEKDVVLDLALKLGKRIRKRFDNVEVIQTRKKDKFVTLMERAKIANRNNADLFISLHCNVAGNHAAHGPETYVLGLHRTEANMEVAKKENSAILLEENYKTRYENFDPKSPESYIALELMQSEFLDQSLDFAAMAQREFENHADRHDRGVKQAGFLVLYKTTMPSVLVESGFLSNEKDKEYLTSNKGKEEMAESLYGAFENYKSAVGNVKIATNGDDRPAPDGEEGGEKKLTASTERSAPVASGKDSLNEERDGAPPRDTDQKEEDSVEGEASGDDAEDIRFRVQIVASSNSIPLEPENFKGFDNVDEYISNGIYKYTVGNEANYNEARKLRNEVRKNGYSGAFIIAIKDGMRIDLQKALSMKSH